MKIGDRFWEVNVAGADDIPYYCYPRWVHTFVHLDYYNRKLGEWTFPTQEEAEKKVKELNKSVDKQ